MPATEPATFSLVVVPKHQRRIAGFDDTVLSLYATVMTTGDIAAQVADVSRELVSKVADPVVGEMAEWQSRPLDLGQFLVIVANQLAMRWWRHRLINCRAGRGSSSSAETRSRTPRPRCRQRRSRGPHDARPRRHRSRPRPPVIRRGDRRGPCSRSCRGTGSGTAARPDPVFNIGTTDWSRAIV